MGRLKAWQNLNPLFSGKYKKLLEEYGSKDYSRLLFQESLQDYLSYACGQCGHIQKLQAEELNRIVGQAFRLAYAKHLQKTGVTVRDVILKHSHGSTPPLPHTLAHIPSQSHSHIHTLSTSGTPLHIRAQINTSHTHPHQRTCSHSSSLSTLQAITTSQDSSFNSNMRTTGSPALAAFHKPSSLPGLHTRPEEDGAVHSPETENSNSQISEDMKLKRVSQISVSSSASSGVVALDVSTSSTRSSTPPPLPERSDSLTPPEEPHLKTAAWFQAGIPREIALEVLSHEPVGAFMVRESTSKPGCYALSLRVPRDFTVSGIAHYLILKTNKGYKIKGFTKEFSTLTALITHHSVMPELLPCPLSLSRYNPTFTTEDQTRSESNDEDPDYNTLSDFRKVMADLNI